ncbi:hypothetical protein Bbelb_252180 [Branchiostoma belcheri]|nr:hypothetical protein Bbelb_252180 [Branchiostoma belcheri]
MAGNFGANSVTRKMAGNFGANSVTRQNGGKMSRGDLDTSSWDESARQLSAETDELMYELQLTRRFDPDDAEEIRRAESHLEMMTEQIFQALDEDRDGQLQMREFVEGFRRNPSLLRLNSVEMTT